MIYEGKRDKYWLFNLKDDPTEQTNLVDKNDTYAPVVDWATVRLLFGTTVIRGWKTRQVDFNQAFIQAPMQEQVYAGLPPTYQNENPGMCLRLKRSLYGDRRAPQLWYKYLKVGMEKRGWKASTLDPSLYMKKGILFAVYCDDY